VSLELVLLPKYVVPSRKNVHLPKERRNSPPVVDLCHLEMKMDLCHLANLRGKSEIGIFV
jgi:hypothetical protein